MVSVSRSDKGALSEPLVRLARAYAVPLPRKVISCSRSLLHQWNDCLLRHVYSFERRIREIVDRKRRVSPPDYRCSWRNRLPVASRTFIAEVSLPDAENQVGT